MKQTTVGFLQYEFAACNIFIVRISTRRRARIVYKIICGRLFKSRTLYLGVDFIRTRTSVRKYDVYDVDSVVRSECVSIVTQVHFTRRE